MSITRHSPQLNRILEERQTEDLIDPTDEKINELQLIIKQQGDMLKHIEISMQQPTQQQFEFRPSSP